MAFRRPWCVPGWCGRQLKEWGAALSRAWPERDRTQRDLREAKKKHAALEVKARDATDDAASAIRCVNVNAGSGGGGGGVVVCGGMECRGKAVASIRLHTTVEH